MKWKDILKNVITQSRVKEIEDIDIDIEDDDCKRKLQRLANKLKNYKLVVGEKWKDGWHGKYVGDEKVKHDNFQSEHSKSFKIRFDSYPAKDYLGETVYYFYNPDDLPESVACRALEILKEEKFYEESINLNGDYYIINRLFKRKSIDDYGEADAVNALSVVKKSTGKRPESLIFFELYAYAQARNLENVQVLPSKLPLERIATEAGIFDSMEKLIKWHR